jgi:hypothetical protein
MGLHHVVASFYSLFFGGLLLIFYFFLIEILDFPALFPIFEYSIPLGCPKIKNGALLILNVKTW